MRKSIFLISFFLLTGLAKAQLVQTKGAFNQDSTKIGEEFTYSLSVRYLSSKDIVFPDSLYDFTPFELNKKVSFETRSDSTQSFDSAVYYLSTFELDTFQTLELPVFMVTDGDSLLSRPGVDTIILRHVVEVIPDSVALMANTNYWNVDMNFNYPYLIVGVTTFVLLALIIFFAFGKRIRRAYLRYRLKKMHIRFLEKFNTEITEAEHANGATKPVEVLVNDWKDYMEKLDRKPFTKLTTKEIAAVIADGNLRKSLANIDKAIYGHFFDKNLNDSFYYLRTVTEEAYQKRLSSLQNG